jgi:hypothetical protein
MYYYLYRFYDPNLQRWINTDPKAEEGFATISLGKTRSNLLAALPAEAAMPKVYNSENEHQFTFVGNNPINNFDGLGLMICTRMIGPMSGIAAPASQCPSGLGYFQVVESQNCFKIPFCNIWGNYGPKKYSWFFIGCVPVGEPVLI